MSGEGDTGNSDVVKLGINSKQYPFKPTDSLVEAVTEMIRDYNISPEQRLIMPGDTVRIRIFYENPEDVPQDGYSLLDKFVFDGEKATTPVTKSTEVEMIGNFARLQQNPDRTFVSNEDVILQIASYGNVPIVKRDTSRFAKGGTVNLASLLGGDEHQPQP